MMEDSSIQSHVCEVEFKSGIQTRRPMTKRLLALADRRYPKEASVERALSPL